MAAPTSLAIALVVIYEKSPVGICLQEQRMRMSNPPACPVCKGTGELTSPGPFGQSIACWVCAPTRRSS